MLSEVDGQSQRGSPSDWQIQRKQIYIPFSFFHFSQKHSLWVKKKNVKDLPSLIFPLFNASIITQRGLDVTGRQPASQRGGRGGAGSLQLRGCSHLAACPGAGTPFPFTGNRKKCQFSLQTTLRNLPQNGVTFLWPALLTINPVRRGFGKAGEGELGRSELSQTQAGISGEGEPRAISLLQKIQAGCFAYFTL